MEYGTKFNFMVYRFHFERLFRGRPFKGKTEEYILNSVLKFKDIWVPPPQFATKQRCNEPENPVLYLASHESTMPHELGLYENDLFVVTKFEQTEDFVYIPILGCEKLMKLGDQGIPSIIKNYFRGKSDEEREIDSTISNLFTSPRTLDPEDTYDQTIGLSNLYFQNGSDGLLYPSVADNFKSVNLALVPEKVRFKLRPIEVSIYKLLKTDSNRSIDVQVLREGIFNDGNYITWSDQILDKYLRYEKNVP